MSKDAAHTRPWEIGEVVFGVPLLLAVILHAALPLHFMRPILTPLPNVLGFLLCAAGISVIVATRKELARFHQPTDPGQPTQEIVTTGVFQVSRNPMYLGAACFLVGVVLVFKLAWLLILLVPTLIACHAILIAPEERYLRAKFGVTYAQYEDSVRRWLGRKRRRGV